MSLLGNNCNDNNSAEIGDTITIKDKIFFQDVSNKQKIEGKVNGDLSFFTNATERISILENGNIGIGTNNPLSNLHIFENNSTINQLRLQNPHASGSSGLSLHNGTDEFRIELDNSNNRVLMYNGMGGIDIQAPEGDIRFYRGYLGSAVEHMRMKDNGTIDVKGKLDLTSTTTGFLPPRLTTAQETTLTAIPPTAGECIYNTTTNKLRCWNGTIWNDCF